MARLRGIATFILFFNDSAWYVSWVNWPPQLTDTMTVHLLLDKVANIYLKCKVGVGVKVARMSYMTTRQIVVIYLTAQFFLLVYV